MFGNKIFLGIIGFTVLMIIIITVLITVNKKHIKQKFGDITNDEKSEMRAIVNKVIYKSGYKFMKKPSNKSEMIEFKNLAIKTYYSIVNDSLIQYLQSGKFKQYTSESVVNFLLQLLNTELNSTDKNYPVPENKIKNHYMVITDVKEYAIKTNYNSLKNGNQVYRFTDLFKKVLFYCDKNYSAANLYNYNNFNDFKLSYENMLKIAYTQTYNSIFYVKEDILMLKQRIMCQNTFVR